MTWAWSSEMQIQVRRQIQHPCAQARLGAPCHAFSCALPSTSQLPTYMQGSFGASLTQKGSPLPPPPSRLGWSFRWAQRYQRHPYPSPLSHSPPLPPTSARAQWTRLPGHRVSTRLGQGVEEDPRPSGRPGPPPGAQGEPQGLLPGEGLQSTHLPLCTTRSGAAPQPGPA